jgi:tetratricopeptide (TPR) repeat protein
MRLCVLASLLLLQDPVVSAREKFARKDYAGAEADLDGAIAKDPKSAELHRFRALVRIEREDLKGALQDLTRTLELGGTTAPVWARRGWCRQRLGDVEGALGDYDRAVGGGFRSLEVLSGRASCRLQSGDWRGAVSDATRALEIDSSNVSARSVRFLAYYALRSWDNAFRDHEGATRKPEPALAWLVLLRRDGPEAARAAVRRVLEGPDPPAPGSWNHRFLSTLSGDRDADLLLQEAESASLGERTDALIFVGIGKLAGGDPDGARKLLQKARELAPDALLPRSVARAELEQLDLEKRAALTDGLQQKFRALGAFRAEFKGTGMTDNSSGWEVRDAVFHVDLARSRVRVSLAGPLPSGELQTCHISCQDAAITVWGGGFPTVRIDGAPFLAGVEALQNDLHRELDLLAPPAKPRKIEPLETGLHLGLERRPGPGQEGNARIALMRSRYPAHWLREIRNSRDAVLREEKDALVAELPSRRKHLAVDLKTGFLRRIEVTDFDGTLRRFELAAFERLDRFPDLEAPPKIPLTPFDFTQLLSHWRQRQEWLVDVLEELVTRRDDFAKAGKEPEARAVVTRWAARYADALRGYGLRAFARNSIRRDLAQGTPLADLARDPDAPKRFAASVASQEAEIRKEIASRLTELAFDLETAAIEVPLDSRLHGPLKDLLRKALDPEAVHAERARTYGDRSQELYREELEAQREL